MPHYIDSLTAAVPLGGHRLRLTFADGFTGELDMLPALEGELFAALLQPREFAAVTIEDGVPTWPSGADIDPATLRIWTETGRVLSHEDTNEYAKHRATSEGVAGAA